MHARAFSLLVLICAAAPAGGGAAPEPSSQYDKFEDVTTVALDLGGVRLGYFFEGKDQAGPVGRAFVALSPDAGGQRAKADAVGRDRPRVVFLLDGERRLPVELDPRSGATAVGVEWLKQIADAKAVEFAIGTGPGRVEAELTGQQLEAVRRLVERTRFYSAEAVAAREALVRKEREARQRAVWDFHGGDPDGATVYVLDASGSMFNYFAQAKAVAVLERAEPSHRFTVLCFQDGRVERMSDALVPATPENKRVAIDWVRGRTVTGTGQGIGDAFRQAAELRPTRILAITEAVLTPEDLAEARESLRRSGVPVNVLAYGPADGEVPTSRVLAGNGGQWRKAPRE